MATPHSETLNDFFKLIIDKKFDTAIEQAQTLAAQYPEFGHPSLKEALTWMNQQEWEKALTAYEQGLKVHSDTTLFLFCKADVLWRMGKHQKAWDFLELIEPKNLFTTLHRTGFVLYNLTLYEEALEAYDKAIELDKKFAAPWYGKGVVFFYRNQYDKALKAFEKAIKLDEKYAYSWHGKGHTFDSLKQYDKALEAYDKAIELDSQLAHPWHGKGNVFFNLQKYKKAIKAYDKAIELDEKFAYPWNGKGNVFDNLQQYDKALEAYDKAIELDTKFALPWHGKGNVFASLQQYNKALKAYNKAIELNRKLAHPWNGKGSVFYNLQQYEWAHRCYLRTLHLNQNIYIQYSLKTHLEILNQINKPFWFEVLLLTLPELRKTISWRSLMQRMEKQTSEAYALLDILAVSNIRPEHQSRIQRTISYHMGNPFPCEEITQTLIHQSQPQLEDYYYLLSAKGEYHEPIAPIREEVLAFIETSLSKFPLKRNHYWAGQIKYLLGEDIQEVMNCFRHAETYLPALYMRLAIIQTEIRVLEGNQVDLEDALDDPTLSEKTPQEIQADLDKITEELVPWEQEYHQVATSIYQQEKEVIYGQDRGFLRFIQEKQPMLRLGLADLIQSKADYKTADAHQREEWIRKHGEIKKHFRRTSHTLLKFKTSLEIREGLWAVEEYAQAFPDNALSKLVNPVALEERLQAFEAWQFFSGKIEDAAATTDAAFEIRMQRLAEESQIKELLISKNTKESLLTILTARVEVQYWQNHPNPKIGNWILAYFYWKGEIEKDAFMILLMYQYVQQYGKSVSGGERWLKNGIKFVTDQLSGFFQISGTLKILKGLGIIDMHDLIDDFMGSLEDEYKLPDFLHFKKGFAHHIARLKENLGQDFYVQFPGVDEAG